MIQTQLHKHTAIVRRKEVSMSYVLLCFVIGLFLLDTRPLRADSPEFAGPPVTTPSGTKPADPGEPGSPATPAEPSHRVEGRHEERLERYNERREARRSRWENTERRLREKMQEMIQRHPERADEIRQTYERRLKQAKKSQNRDLLQRRYEHWQKRSQEIRENQRDDRQARRSRNR